MSILDIYNKQSFTLKVGNFGFSAYQQATGEASVNFFKSKIGDLASDKYVKGFTTNMLPNKTLPGRYAISDFTDAGVGYYSTYRDEIPIPPDLWKVGTPDDMKYYGRYTPPVNSNSSDNPNAYYKPGTPGMEGNVES